MILKGDLKLSLWDEEGTEEIQVVDASTPEQNAEVLAFPKAEKEDQEFLLRIEGAGGAENFYVLRLDAPQGQPNGSDSSENEDQEQEQDPSENEDEQEQEQEPQEEEQDPMEQAIEQLDRNDSNLEAEEAARQNPFAGPPVKDW